MAQRSSSAVALLLLGCFAMQAAAMPMHPDLLSFINLPTASVSEELQQTAARRLQESKKVVIEKGKGPLTTDTISKYIGDVGTKVYDEISSKIYDEIFSLKPLTSKVGGYLNKDVGALFGYDALDKFVSYYLERATASVGDIVDAGCVGPTYSLIVNGGECEIQDDGSVECQEPYIEFIETPFICNLPYRSGAELKGQSFTFKKEFGKKRSGLLGPEPSVYSFSAAVNITKPSLNITDKIDDFGIQKYFSFLGSLIVNELVKIESALVEAAGRKVEHFDKVAQWMGVPVEKLTAGLGSVGIKPAVQEPVVLKAEGAQNATTAKAAPRAAVKGAAKPK